MSERFPPKAPVIDVEPRQRRRWRIWVFVALLIALFSLSRVVSIYLSALWFGSLGYSDVYWYIFKLKVGLFFLFAILTTLLLQSTFWLFQKLFGAAAFENRTILLHNQPFQFSPARVIRPLAWLIAIVVGLIYGLMLKDSWQKFALYWHRPYTASVDPIFGKPLGFYLFALPVYESISSWLTGVTFIILAAAIAYSFLGLAH